MLTIQKGIIFIINAFQFKITFLLNYTIDNSLTILIPEKEKYFFCNILLIFSINLS